MAKRKYKLRIADTRNLKVPEPEEVGPGEYVYTVTEEDKAQTSLLFQLERINFKLCIDNYIREEMLRKQKPLTEEDVEKVVEEAYMDFGKALEEDESPRGYIAEVVNIVDPKQEFDFIARNLFWERFHGNRE